MGKVVNGVTLNDRDMSRKILGANIRKIDSAVHARAKVMEVSAKSKIDDTVTRTGKLKRSVTVTKDERWPATYKIYMDEPYGGSIEWGYTTNNKKAFMQRYIPGRHMLRQVIGESRV